jgi:hypothetical protein
LPPSTEQLVKVYHLAVEVFTDFRRHFLYAIGRFLAIAILFPPHEAIGRCSVSIFKMLNVDCTSYVIQITGYKIFILLLIDIQMLLEKW